MGSVTGKMVNPWFGDGPTMPENGTVLGKISIRMGSFKIWRHSKMTNLNGVIRSWDEDGQLLVEGTYRDDKRHGKFLTYKAGKLVSEALWEDGIRRGSGEAN